MPTLLIKSAAEKDIRDLPPDLRARLIAAIRTLRETPFPTGVQKLRGLDFRYRLRVGDYRILYTFEATTQIATIYRVKHRREVYR